MSRVRIVPQCHGQFSVGADIEHLSALIQRVKERSGKRDVLRPRNAHSQQEQGERAAGFEEFHNRDALAMSGSNQVNASLTEALAILTGDDEGPNHLGVDEVAVKLI